MRPHTRPRRPPWSTASRTGRTSTARVLGRRLVFAGRRVLPARRPAVPRRRTAYEGFAMHEDGVGMARTFELELSRRQADEPTGVQRRLLRLGRRRAGRATSPRTAGVRAATAARASRTAGTELPVTLPPVAPGAGRRSSPGTYGARVLGPLVGAPRPRRRARRRRSTTSSSAAPPASPACWWARTSPACSPTEPEGHRYLLPDVCLSDGRFLDGTDPGRPAPPGRDRRHRRPSPCARRWPSTAAASSRR